MSGAGLRGRVAVLLAAFTVVGCAEEGDRPDPLVSTEAPDSFLVAFETSAGDFELAFHRAWGPVAVDRVYQLAQDGFWNGARIYRVNDRYAQFGYSGRPAHDSLWVRTAFPDEPVLASNTRGTVSFARGGPDTRSAILFINRSDNTNLDDLDWNDVVGFPPVGRVSRGMDAVDVLYSGYGDDPMQWEDSIAGVGNPFLDRRYPELDSIVTVRVVDIRQ